MHTKINSCSHRIDVVIIGFAMVSLKGGKTGMAPGGHDMAHKKGCWSKTGLCLGGQGLKKGLHKEAVVHSIGEW